MKKLVVTSSILFLLTSAHVFAQCGFTGTFNVTYTCSMSQVKLGITGNPPSEFSTYVIYNGSNSYTGTVTTSPILRITWNSVAAGTYTLMIDDVVCSGKTVTVSPPAATHVSITGPPTLYLCQGDPVTVIATGASSYSWTSTDGGSWGNVDRLTLTPVTTATFTVTGMDNCGRVTTSSVEIVVTPQVGSISSIVGTSSRLMGSGSDAYTASATNATSYTWSIAPTSAGSLSQSGVPWNSTQLTWNSTFTGMATLTAVAHGCNSSSSASFTKDITVSDPCGFTGSFNVFYTCTNQVKLGITANAPSTSSTFVIYNGSNSYTGTVTTDPIMRITWNNVAAGNYTLTIDDVVCPGKTVTVSPAAPIQVSISGPQPTYACEGSVLSLTANNAASYSWTSSGGGSWPSGATLSINNPASETFTVTGMDECGRITTASRQVIVVPTPNTTLTPSGTSIKVCSTCHQSISVTQTSGAVRRPSFGMREGSLFSSRGRGAGLGQS